MDLLTKNRIMSEGIVLHPEGLPISQYRQLGGERDSTYDATVGKILCDGKSLGSSIMLAPRGVVWVISYEEFKLPKNITAIASLRTTWAHNGIFALNVGIVDPGYHGPVATALVNFSTEDFEVRIGDPFMRLMFLEHDQTDPKGYRINPKDYLKKIKTKSRAFSKSFLSMNALVDDVAREIFKMPKLAALFAYFGILIALLSILAPIAYTIYTGVNDDKMAIARLQLRLDQLESTKAINDLDRRQGVPSKAATLSKDD